MNNSIRLLLGCLAMFVTTAALAQTGAPVLPENASSGWWNTVQADLAAQEYHFCHAETGWQSPNRAQNLRSTVTESGFTLAPRVDSLVQWTQTFALQQVGRPTGEALTPAPNARFAATGNALDVHHPGFTLEYRNSQQGLRHNVLVTTRPTGEGPLQAVYQLSGTLTPTLTDAGTLTFTQAGETHLTYSQLRVTDATGRQLPAHFELTGTELAIVVDDAQAQYPVWIDPLAATPAWTAESDQLDAWFGWSVAGAGDVNGDGFSDVIVGARFFDNGQTDEGRAYVFLGSAAGLDTIAAWTAESDQEFAEFGYSVAGAGDVNNDGFDDVLVGARFYSNVETEEGRAFLFLGGATGLDTTAAWTAESNQFSALFGYSVAGAGDVNNDGFDDVIVGAPGFNDGGTTDAGRADVFMGSTAGLADTAAWTVVGEKFSALFGVSVAGAGDVNGDGFSDVIVGANEYENGENDEGRAFVYLGSAAGLDTAATWTAESNQFDAEFGKSVAGAGDVNGDGFSDVIVGASLYENGEFNEGGAFMYLGSAAGLDTAAAWTAESNQSVSRFGGSVAGAGDVNNDGFSDVIVGAWLFENGQTSEGRAYVYLGSATGLATTPAWTAESDQINAQFGYSVAGAGDVNGDGFSDVIVGSDLFDNGQDNEGRAFAYYGQATTRRPTPSAEALQFQAFPNPASGRLTFTHQLPQGGATAQLTVLDATGRSIYTAPLDPTQTTTELDVSTWAAGIYVAQLRTEAAVTQVRVAVR